MATEEAGLKTQARYTLAGGLIGIGFGLVTGLVLPVIFISCSLGAHFHLWNFLAVASAIALVYVPASAVLGAWIGWNLGMEARVEPGFRFSGVASELVRGFLAQKVYRLLALLTVLFILLGGGFSAYLQLSGKAACLEFVRVKGEPECVRTSWFMTR